MGKMSHKGDKGGSKTTWLIAAVLIAAVIIGGFVWLSPDEGGQGFLKSPVTKHKPLPNITEQISPGIALITPQQQPPVLPPEDGLTRCQAAVLLVAMSGLEADVPDVPTFPDVPSTLYCYDAVEILQANGIIMGASDGKFYPKDVFNRAEVAKLVMVAFDLPIKENCEVFADVQEEFWYFDYVGSLAYWGGLCGADVSGRTECPLPDYYKGSEVATLDWFLAVLTNLQNPEAQTQLCD